MIRSRRQTFLKSVALILTLGFWCEFLVYYLVLFQCGYPSFPASTAPSRIRTLILADTHLLGSRNGHWFDKLRREWQMHRAFSTAYYLFHPEMVIFLGDLFDEGKWCGPDEFEYYVQRFHDLFPIDPGHTLSAVVAGNHDIGFHYSVTPYLNNRFENAFEMSSIERFSLKGVHFVSVNSMAMEGDDCFLCAKAQDELNKISGQLECLARGNDCDIDYDFGDSSQQYSRPILLQHFPLFRESDAICNEEDEAPANEKRKPFREKWDCLSRNASQTLLDVLNPRLVLSGHTHHGCRVKHDRDIWEWSVSSFSWRNRNNPTFLLGTFSSEQTALSKCFMPSESFVIDCYMIGGILIVVHFVYSNYRFRR